ncbi:MAG: hypothetical protein ACJ77Z_03275 [Thermoleophilaceae bacterium]
MRPLPWMASALALAAIAPATASGATIELVSVPGGKEVRYVAGPGEFNDVNVNLFEGKIVVQDGVNYGVIPVTAVSPCEAQPYVPASSPTWRCPASGVTSIFVDLGDEADYAGIGAMSSLLMPVHVLGGAGNDDIFSRDNFADEIDCGSGTDRLRADTNDVRTGCEQVEGTGAGEWTRADGKPIGVSINRGARFTNDPDVVVTAYGPDATTLTTIANDGGFLDGTEFPAVASSSYRWRLQDSASERLPQSVYVRFAGAGLDSTRTFSDDIILDTTRPVVTAARMTRGALRVAARDSISGVAAIQLRSGARAKPSPFSKFSSARHVHGRAPFAVRVRDRARNVSGWRRVSR